MRGRRGGHTAKLPNLGAGSSGLQPPLILGPFDTGNVSPPAAPAAPPAAATTSNRSGRPAPRGKRIFSEAVYNVLEALFESNRSPKPDELQAVAALHCVDYLKVSQYFQSKRRNTKRKEEKDAGRTHSAAAPTAGKGVWTVHERNRYSVDVVEFGLSAHTRLSKAVVTRDAGQVKSHTAGRLATTKRALEASGEDASTAVVEAAVLAAVAPEADSVKETPGLLAEGAYELDDVPEMRHNIWGEDEVCDYVAAVAQFGVREHAAIAVAVGTWTALQVRDHSRDIAKKVEYHRRLDAVGEEDDGPQRVRATQLFPCGIISADGKTAVRKVRGEGYVTLDAIVASKPVCDKVVEARGFLCHTCNDWADRAVEPSGHANGLSSDENDAIHFSIQLQPVLLLARREAIDRRSGRRVSDGHEGAPASDLSDAEELRRDGKRRRGRNRAPLPPNLPPFCFKS